MFDLSDLEILRLKWSELKQITEDRGPDVMRRGGRGAFLLQWSFDVSQDGAIRSENAGMSNDSPDENSGYRMFEVSSATSVDWGLVGSNRPTER